MKRLTEKQNLADVAWTVHRERGHQPEYDGPCWGPTLDDLAEAKRRLAGLTGDKEGPGNG